MSPTLILYFSSGIRNMYNKLDMLAALVNDLPYLEHPDVQAMNFAIHVSGPAQRVRDAIQNAWRGMSEVERSMYRAGGGVLPKGLEI